VQHRPSVISGPTVIVARHFKMQEKPHDAVEGQCVKGDLGEPTGDIGRHERQKQPQSIAMRPDRGWPQALLEWEFIDQKCVQQCAK